MDWLVHMRRLPAEHALQQHVAEGTLTIDDMDALLAGLARFYRSAVVVKMSGADYIGRLKDELVANREILLGPQFHVPDAALALDSFGLVLSCGAELLQARAEHHHLVDGHGDLRPDHVFLTDPIVVIDCLEFNHILRQVDPFDEIAYLGLECELAGQAWVGPHLWFGLAKALRQSPPPALAHLYTAHRALQRARLAVAHLLDPQPRTPERWVPLAARYIARAQKAIDAFNSAITRSDGSRFHSPTLATGHILVDLGCECTQR